MKQAADYTDLPDAVQALIAGVSAHNKESDITPVSAAMRAQKQERIKNAVPGNFIEGEGIFIGRYAPQDADGKSTDGKSLGLVFNVFAAPEDLTDKDRNKETFRYHEAVRCIAGLKNWHGSDGADYHSDKEILEALKNGSYDGGWIIPPLELLAGRRAKGGWTEEIKVDNLYGLRNKSTLKGKFAAGDDDFYWSSTEEPNLFSRTLALSFKPHKIDWFYNDGDKLKCRPVRLVPVAQDGSKP
jgi:hypothetical protein